MSQNDFMEESAGVHPSLQGPIVGSTGDGYQAAPSESHSSGFGKKVFGVLLASFFGLSLIFIVMNMLIHREVESAKNSILNVLAVPIPEKVDGEGKIQYNETYRNTPGLTLAENGINMRVLFERSLLQSQLLCDLVDKSYGTDPMPKELSDICEKLKKGL